MNNKKIIIFVIIFSVVILSIIGTYAFFSTSDSSSENALKANSASFDISLEVTPLFVSNKLIPMDDELAITGYNNNCIDSNNFDVCQAYEIKLANTAGTGQDEHLVGTINFSLRNIKNLSYMVLDSDGNIYHNSTSIINNNNSSLGNMIDLKDGEYTSLILLIWLSNLKDKNQGLDDAGGNFNASITYVGVAGDTLSSTITGNID